MVDLSDLGFQPEEKKKNIDLSDLGFESEKPSKESSSTLMDSARGAAQGATAGFADEIISGAISLLDPENIVGREKRELLDKGFTGDIMTTGKLYQDQLDTYRAEDKKAQENSPAGYVLGNLLGSVAPGVALGKAIGPMAQGLSLPSKAALQKVAPLSDEALKLAGAVQGPLNRATAGQILKNNLTGGLASGAISGAGMSEANLTEGEVGKFLKDVTSDAALGGALGLGVTGAHLAARGAKNLGQKGANWLSKTKIAENFRKAKDFGKEGIDLSSREGLAATEEVEKVLADKIALTTDAIQKHTGKALGEKRAQLIASGAAQPVKEELNTIKNVIESLKESNDPGALRDANFLEEWYLNTTKGKEVPVEVSNIFKTFKPGKTKEIPASPSTLEKLQEEVKKLQFQSARAGENAKFNIVEDVDDAGNKYLSILKSLDEQVNAVERPLIDPETGKTLGLTYQSLKDLPDNFKSNVRVTKPQLAASGNPASTVSEPVTVNVNKLVRTIKQRPGNVLDDSLGQAEKIRKELTGFGRAGREELNTNEALNAVGSTAQKIQNKIMENKELAPLNQKAAAAYQILDDLGLTSDSFRTNPYTGETVVTPQQTGKLMDAIRQYGAETSTGTKRRNVIDTIIDLMKPIDNEKAVSLQKEIAKTADRINLTQEAQKLSLLNRATFTKSIPIRVGNFVGRTIHKYSPKQLEDVANQMLLQGGDKAHWGKQLLDAAKKNSVARNSVLFSLEQQPAFREAMKNFLGLEEEDK